MGDNGVGKTTLLKAMLGMVRHSAGSLSIFGMEVGSREWLPSRRRGSLARKARRTYTASMLESPMGAAGRAAGERACGSL
jgi:ABC-type multidrug transport system ATPase subunit